MKKQKNYKRIIKLLREKRVYVARGFLGLGFLFGVIIESRDFFKGIFLIGGVVFFLYSIIRAMKIDKKIDNLEGKKKQ